MKVFVCCSALLLLLVVEVSHANEPFCVCPTYYKKLSCTADQISNRILPDLILSGRDKTSPVYDEDFKISWVNYKYWLDRFVCECGRRAEKQFYQYFGTEFYGECWAGNLTDSTYPEDASCIDGNYLSPCTGRNCIGEQFSLQMYQIYRPTCDVGFERVGCFKDKTRFRTLPELLFTDRNTGENGISIPWEVYDQFLPDLACRCAQAARTQQLDLQAAGELEDADNYRMFGLQFWGECWSGVSPDRTYYRWGEKHWEDEKCFDRCFRTCSPKDTYCTGKGSHNFVYRTAIVDAEGNALGDCPTTHQIGSCHQGQLTDAVELINEFDPLSEVFNGKLRTELTNWSVRFIEFLCNCAVTAEYKGMAWFGVSVRGKCVGSLSTPSFNNDGTCLTPSEDPCGGSELCGGESGDTPSWQIYTLA